MKNCRNYKALMPSYIFDYIKKTARLKLERHLRDCAECSEELEETAKTLKIMSQHEHEKRDRKFWEMYRNKLKISLQRELEREKSKSNRLRRALEYIYPREYLKQFAITLAVTFIAGIVVASLYFNSWQPLHPVLEPEEIVADLAISKTRKELSCADNPQLRLKAISSIDTSTSSASPVANLNDLIILLERMALYDSDEEVRAYAIEALSRVHGGRGVQSLIRIVENHRGNDFMSSEILLLEQSDDPRVKIFLMGMYRKAIHSGRSSSPRIYQINRKLQDYPINLYEPVR